MSASNNVIDAISEQAATAVRGLTTAQLIEAMELTDKDHSPHIPTVRGWIMDALEDRDAAGFLAWLDDNGRNIRKHFGLSA